MKILLDFITGAEMKPLELVAIVQMIRPYLFNNSAIKY